MELFAAFVLLAIVIALLAAPFYRSGPNLVYGYGGALNDLLAQRDGIYATLRDLDLDYQLGKLAASDYQARREKYIARAALTLRQLDELRGADPAHQDMSAAIESEVFALRRNKSIPPQLQSRGERVRPSRRNQRGRQLICSNCGSETAPEDRFCSKCGRALA